MENLKHIKWDNIVFADSIKEYDRVKYADYVLHILCLQGNMSFTLHDIRYNITIGDYVILPNVSLASTFSESSDFQALVIGFSMSFFSSIAIRSNYGIIGQLSMLRNPVIRLSADDFKRCREDILFLRERMDNVGHLFYGEMLGHLLAVHILDLHDIHARKEKAVQVSERKAIIVRQFIELLYQGEYIRNRNLGYYASRLCVTSHYLTEVCKEVSSEPASYWIDRFTTNKILGLLRQKEISLTEIADRMNFSSLSYFSRYVLQKTGMSPSEYRANKILLNG